ncbi:MAG: Coenzyme F420 hydrogenase/dehydrogenase, beta subunit C-terminal domain [Candidatus Bathyarchaeota archaeon]|nr:Coenzyme F420 hydrogenase/dehydrogenase, beta subunit C-terminal domain [Candidatus Bathyarchaeota archaeon]MCX8177064.1 Coenzyme F420 hydrogenase/dehydrogenase, beta subunit C-terminal domain [Candidatus Bathyarchaeota archaeon]MDW8194197.1 Coenzyme F420 hydrogenase/dehydrogenase, beta subunit C-terminal domain [Nitrososphaerota archaeon]
MEANIKEVNLTINGVHVKAQKGTPILEVARQIGVEIPTLCYIKGLSPYGSCRICSVEITTASGRKRIVTSCNYPAEEGLVVETDSERVVKVRRNLLRLLLARCPKVTRLKNLASLYGLNEPDLWVENDSEDCILCGLCVRVCNELIRVSAINFANRGIKRTVTTPYDEFSEDCIGCGACAMICPTGSKKVRTNNYSVVRPLAAPQKDEKLGAYIDILSAKSSIEGQDGGVVTALLLSGLKNGMFNKAVVVKRKSGYRAEAVIASTPEEIMEARGTKYFRIKIVPKIKELISKGERKIAVVGTPCQVRAARKIQQILQQEHPDLDITIIGLFCFESFEYEKLKAETARIMGVNLDDAEKTQIKRGKFIVSINGHEYSCKVKELDHAISNGCPYCSDFPAFFADVSVGAVGSPDGYSTVILRTDKGKKLVENTCLEYGRVNVEEITKLSSFKKNRAKENFEPLIREIQAVRLKIRGAVGDDA